VWAEIRDALALYNAQRSAIVRLVSYQVAGAGPQGGVTESMEEATEFGEPRAIREPPTVLNTWLHVP
jgi:hypothetical protein